MLIASAVFSGSSSPLRNHTKINQIGEGGGSLKQQSAKLRGSAWRRVLGASTALAGLFALEAAAGPQDGQVVAGQAAIQQAGGGRTNVVQSTDRAVIDWRGFSIGAGEHVDFQQPGANSVTLNRVTGSQTSLIDGRLTATGNVFIVNPNGVIFGRGASVDVGGLVATTTDLSNANFMAGRYILDRPSGVAGAAVVNEGSISIRDGGLAALVAPTVRNSGVITARLGRVALGGAETATVDLYGDGLIAFDTGVSTSVTHDGAIHADGGSVLLTTAEAKGVVDGAINMGGTVTARSVEKQGGKIVLKGAGSVAVAGTLDASGREAGGTGGEVKVLGESVTLQATARVDVSGDQGGGVALIGGNVQGQGPEQRAAGTLVTGGALIAADALSTGNGGTVVVWSDGHTRFDGAITARGGAAGGDGGFVETSGKETLGIATGKVDASAPKGKGGQWLLDPRNVEIAAATANGALAASTFTPTADNATVAASAIQAALNAGTDVTITTADASGTQAGNITTSAGVTWTSAATLTLIADGAITLSNDFTGTAGTLDLRANNSISQAAGTISVATLRASVGSAASITLDKANQIGTLGAFSAGGSFTLNDTTGGLIVSGVTTATGGAVSITTAGGALSLQGNLSGNSISLNTTGAITQSGGSITAASVSFSAGGAVSLGSANAIDTLASGSAGGAITLNDAAGGLTVSGTVSGTGAVAISTSGGALAVQSDIAGTALQLSGSGLSVAAGVTLDGAAGTVLLDGGAGSLSLGAGTLVLGTGSVTLRADSMAIDSAAQVGGTAAGSGSAASVTLTGSTAGRSIGIAGGSGDLALSADELATIRATDGIIGSATSGAITFDDWTPAATFASGTLTVTGNAGISFAGAVSRTGNLVLNPGGAVSQSDALTVTGDTTINAAGFDVTLDDAGNDFQGSFGGSAAALTLKGGSITFAALSVASLDLTTTGAVVQTADTSLSVTGAASIDAGGNAVTLEQSGNDFQGALAVTGGAISITDTNALSLGDIDAGSLTIAAGGDVTQEAGSSLSVSGEASVDAGSNAITLTRAGNNFQGAVSLSGGAVSINDANALSLGTTSATALTVTANGALTQTGDITVTGSSSVDAGNGTITFDRAGNDFQGALSIEGGAVTIANAGALTLGTSDVDSLSITAGGAITQADGTSLAVSSTASFAAGSNAITLDRTGNDFGGAVSASGGAVSITGTGAITLGTVAAASLGVAAGGNVTQDGGTSLSIIGTTSVAAGTSTVTLTASGNDFGGAVSVTGGTVSLNDTGAIAFGSISASSLAVTAGGDISQATGALTVTGTTTLGTSAGAITVAQTTNDFGGAVSAAATTTVSIRDANALVVGNVSGTAVTLRSNGTLTQSAGTAISATGATTLNAGAGAITLANAGNDFTGTVAVTTSGDISLRDANALAVSVGATGTLTLRATGDISIQDTGALALGNIDAASFTVTAGGAVTQVSGSSIETTGTTSITVSSGAITLDAAANSFGGTLSLSGAGSDASVAATGDIDFGGVSVASLTVAATGALSQSTGSITVTGATTLSAGVITLATAANNFGGTVTVTGAAVSLADVNALTLGNVTASSLAIDAGGALAQAASTTLQVAGTSSFEGTTVTLANAGNSFGDAVSVTAGGAVSLAAADLEISGITAGSGAITITADSMALSGSIATTGAVTLRPQDKARGIRLGAEAAGNLSLTDAELNALSGASGLVIGWADGTGTITVAGALDLTGNAGSLSLLGGAIALGQSITTSGNITFGAATTLSASASPVLTSAGGSVSLAAGVEGSTDGGESLVIQAGSTVTLGAVGAAVRLSSLDVSGSLITMAAGTSTTGSQSYTGSVVLSGASTFTTEDATFTVTGGIRGSGAGGQDLGIDVGSGALSIGSIGAGTAVGAFAASAGSLAFTSIAATGDVTLTASGGGISVGTLSHGSGTVLLTADSIDLSDNWSGSGARTVRPRNAGRALTLGTAGSGFELTAAELAFLGNGSPVSITIGRAEGTGAVSITPFAFDDDLAIQGGGITLQTGTLSWSNASALSLVANGDIVLFGGISGPAGSLLLNATGSVIQAPSATIFGPLASPITVGSLSATAGGDIILNGPFLFAFAGNSIAGRADLVAGGAIAYRGIGNLSLGTVSAGSLAVTGVADISQTADGAITTAGTASFVASGSVDLGRAVNDFGGSTGASGTAVTLADANALILGNVAALSLTVTAGGALTQAGDVSVGGTTSITGSGAAITLDRSGNDFGGPVTITSAGDTALADQNDLLLGNVTASSLTVAAQGSLGQVAGTVLAIAGTTALNAVSITLANAGNDFTGAVSAASAGAVSLRDANALVLGTTGAAVLTLTAGGALTQTGGIVVGGAMTIAAGTGAVTLDRADNDFQGAVSVTGGAVTLADTNALLLGTITAASIDLSSGGAVTQSGDLTVAGTTVIAAGGNAVTLDRAGNDFQAALSVTGGAVALTDQNALVLGTTGAGSLAVIAGGAISQSGAISVADATTIAAGASAVTLDNPANDFGGAVTVTAGTVSIADADALRIGGITGALTTTSGALTLDALTAGSLDATATGAIAQTAAIAILGTTALSAGTASITLADAGNSFGGPITASTTATVSLRDGGAIVLGSIAAGALEVQAVGNVAQAGGSAIAAAGAVMLSSNGGDIALRNITAGALTVTTGGAGAISQASGALLIGGTTALATASGAITVEQSGNDFTGAVTASSAGAVSVRDANALLLGDISAAALTLRSAGAMTQAAGALLAASGPTSLTASAGGAIILANAGNSFGSPVTFSTTGAVSLSNAAGGMVLGNASAGALTLDVTGNLTQVTGTTLTAGASNLSADGVTLDNAGNNFTGAVSVNSAGDVSLADSGALDLGTVTAAALTLRSGGALTQSGDITATGATVIDAGNNDVTLARAGNDFQGPVMLTGEAVALTDQNALTLAGMTAASLVLAAGGPITQTGDVVVTGTSTISAGANDVTLDRSGNDFGGAVTVAGGSVSIADANSLRIGGTTGALLISGAGVVLDATTAASLTIATGGGITQAGDVSIGGPTTLAAGIAGITLDRAGNDFGGAVTAVTAGTVRLSDAGAMLLGSIAAGILDITVGGSLAQAGDTAITVAGTTKVTGSGSSIALDRAGNDFGGAVTITGGGATALADQNDLLLGAVSATSLAATAQGGLSQSASTVLVVSGATILNAAAITLDNAGNDFAGPVSSASVGAFALRDVNALLLGSTAAGSLALTVGGTLTQTGDVVVSGTTVIAAGNNAITLTRGGNDFQGAIALSGGGIALVDANGVLLAASSANALTVTAGGDISQSGTLTVANALILNAGTGVIMLADTANAFDRLSILAAGGATIAKAGALEFGTVNITGDFAVAAGGAITQSADIFVGGTASFSTVPGADILLNRTGNDFAVFTASGGRDVSVTDKDDLVLGPLSASRAATLAAGGNLTQSGALSAGTLAGASGGDGTLDRADNLIGALGGFSAGGRLDIASAAATFVISGAVQASGGISLIAAATGATLSVQGTASVAAGAADLLLQGDDIQIASAITGSGVVTLQSTTVSRNITLGAAVAGELSLQQSEIDLIADGHARINIGREDGSGRIDIRTVTFRDPVTFRSPAPGGSVGLNGTLTGQGNASFEFLGSGATTTLNGSIITAGQDIVFNDAVRLGAALPLSTQPGRQALPTAVLDTTANGSVPTGADVTFMKNVDASTSFLEGLDIFAGTQGTVAFQGDIGANMEVGRLRVFSGSSFRADVTKIMTRILDIDVVGLTFARNVTATDELLIRGIGGTADLTLSSVRGQGDAFAAFFVRRPDGVSASYTINGCIMATTCGMDMVFQGVSLPPYRDDPDAGSRGTGGSLGSPAMRTPRLLSAGVQSSGDDFSIQYSSPADRELW